MTLSLVKQFIADYELLEDNEKVIVGVSGGADSVALLDLLHCLKYKCVVAHCNFHLRGEESDRDAEFVRKLCKRYNIKLEQVDFDTTGYAKKNAMSIEMAARELRYNWFEELRVIHLADKIAVAHHSDDSAETVLLNLIRGTGIRGLTGIAPINECVVRPLLCLNRKQIIEYLKDRKIDYVNDSTNSEDLYTRNKIRLNVIPLLETINPSVRESINRTAEYLAQVESVYSYYIEQVKGNIFSDNIIDIKALVSYIEPEAILFEILHPYNFNSATVRQICESLASQSGKIFYSNTHELLKDRAHLYLKKRESLTVDSFTIHENETSIAFPVHMTIEMLPKSSDFTIEKNANILYIDADKINYPLTIRKWRQGDWFVPFGMKGKKKLSDFFTDNKFSLFEKEEAWLLCSGEDIVWLIGVRSDDRFRVNSATLRVLKVTLQDKA